VASHRLQTTFLVIKWSHQMQMFDWKQVIWEDILLCRLAAKER
jgi:hypothetical protein